MRFKSNLKNVYPLEFQNIFLTFSFGQGFEVRVKSEVEG